VPAPARGGWLKFPVLLLRFSNITVTEKGLQDKLVLNEVKISQKIIRRKGCLTVFRPDMGCRIPENHLNFISFNPRNTIIKKKYNIQLLLSNNQFAFSIIYLAFTS
jgi:hypothetical protein